MTKFQNRESDFPIEPFFLSRISSRSFSDDRLTSDELMSLFEAARWAPSSYNNQPWRFIYARRDEKEWDCLFKSLVEFNQSWCKNADTLVLILSKKTFDHNEKPSITHSFDTGAAWMSLAIEARAKGIIAHGMQGFNYETLKKELQIPDHYQIEAMVALGKPGKPEALPKDLQEKEKPSLRKPLSEIASKDISILK